MHSERIYPGWYVRHNKAHFNYLLFVFDHAAAFLGRVWRWFDGGKA